MRQRAEIEKQLQKTTNEIGATDQNLLFRVMVELLLDIRDLLRRRQQPEQTGIP
jgi:hypothetical protein